jgi:phage terminase Nu1 subunit (DNA packaging protein)
MRDRHVSRAEIAERLNLTERRITELVKDGKLADGTVFPSRVDGRDRKFPVQRCFEWYLRFKQEEAVERAAGRTTPANMAEAELRRAIADAELAELKLQRLRGEVVPLETYRNELRRVLSRVRGRFQAVPGEFAPRILEPLDMVKATSVLKDLVGTVLAELQHVSIEDAGDSDERAAVA